MEKLREKIQYSEKYYDDKFEYRHVYLPKELAKRIPSDKLLSEREWRAMGIQMSRGWIHYGHHNPEPHILLFRRIYQGNATAAQEEKIQEMLQQTKF